jgi:hypothetical protein
VGCGHAARHVFTVGSHYHSCCVFIHEGPFVATRGESRQATPQIACDVYRTGLKNSKKVEVLAVIAASLAYENRDMSFDESYIRWQGVLSLCCFTERCTSFRA